MGKHEPTTQELRVAQDDRARAEDTAAHEAVEEAEARTHRRRADKAAYLRDKLREAERSEADARAEQRQ